MVLNSIGVGTKRKIMGVTLGGLALSQIPVADEMVSKLLDYTIVEPVSVGLVLGLVGLVGAYLLLANEAI